MVGSVRDGSRRASEFDELSLTGDVRLKVSITRRMLEERRGAFSMWTGLLIALDGVPVVVGLFDVEVFSTNGPSFLESSCEEVRFS